MRPFVPVSGFRNPKDRRNHSAIREHAVPVADELLFQRLLSLERRRCERAGTRFALVLVGLDVVNNKLTMEASQEIAHAIGASMRETDIVGWYRESSVIGIILTALTDATQDTLESVVVERIRRVLSLSLDPALMGQIRISCHVFPGEDSGRISGSSTKPDRMFYPDGQKNDFKNKSAAAIKKAVDISGSLVALLLLSPLFIIISVLIRLTSPGPVFFRQKRIGQFGKEFSFLKFRSMYVNSDPAIHREYIRKLIDRKVGDSDGAYKIKHDPRVTRIGKFLRKSSLDELPQFINVLRGDMSLVGPRPPIPYEFEEYSLWHCRRVLEARPGITGAWQVDGRSRTTFDEMVRMDLRYIRNQCFWLDIRILLKTPFAVLRGDGAF
jgi:lipopolysaccharide/colanic/teichoic acid biosynthesis glycosyltransferase